MAGRGKRALRQMTLLACSAAVMLVGAGMSMPDGYASAAGEWAGQPPVVAASAQSVSSCSDAVREENRDAGEASFDDTDSRQGEDAEKSGYILPLDDDEMELLARVISAEARGESFDGQVAVGAVVLNRVECRDFPDSVSEVCHQPGAFCGVTDGQIDIEPSESCRAAAEAAARGEDPTGGAVYFYNPKTAASAWIRSRPVVVIIGNHCFCV